jgi:LAS seventeen-binding protein 1/2
VSVLEEKSHTPHHQPTSYGNLPLEVSQSGSSGTQEPSKQSKFEEQGKKFGKKMGNAGTFQLPIHYYLKHG